LDNITVLAPIRRLPSNASIDISVVKNITKELQSNYNVNLVWLVVLPKSEDTESYQYHNLNIINFFDYDNIQDIINSINPDLIIVRPSIEPINLALSICCKQYKIPVITAFFRIGKINSQPSLSKSFLPLLRSAFSKNVKGDINSKKNKSYFKGFNFFLKRFFFMSRSVSKSFNFFKSLHFFINYFRLLPHLDKMHPILSGDLNLCKSESEKNLLVDSGFESTTIKCVGNPAFDELYLKKNNLEKNNSKKDDKIRLLFCTSTLHEHGFWSKEKEFELIKSVIKNILSNPKFEMNLKIHPSSSSMHEYLDELQKFNQSINIYQKEDLVELINQHDVMITYGGTSVVFYGLVMNIPIISLNLSDDPDWLLTEPKFVTFDCKDINELQNLVLKSIKKDISKKINLYVQKHIGIFDGQCSIRCAKEIASILKK